MKVRNFPIALLSIFLLCLQSALLEVSVHAKTLLVLSNDWMEVL